MGEVISLEGARQAANKLVDAGKEAEKEQQSVFEGIMDKMSIVNESLGGMEELVAMLDLPDEYFTIIGTAFLFELEKSLNNVNDKMLMVQAVQSAGFTCQDIQAEYKAIAGEIDKIDGVSNVKKDFLKQMIAIVYNGIADTMGASKRRINIPIELCHPDAKMPTYADPGDSGMDVYAVEDVTIAAGETVLVPTGLKMAIPFGYELQVRPKSGRALKTKLRIANTPGTIDSGYREEIKIIVDNIAAPIKDAGENGTLYGEAYTIEKGDKFCQLVLCEVPKAFFTVVESVKDIDNDGRDGGFGSTGVK